MRLAGVGTTQQVSMIKLQDANEEKVCQNDPGRFNGQDRRYTRLMLQGVVLEKGKKKPGKLSTFGG